MFLAHYPTDGYVISSLDMDLQDWLFVVTAAAAVGQVGALIAMMLQLRDFRKQTHFGTQATHDSTRATVWLEMLAIDRFFL